MRHANPITNTKTIRKSKIACIYPVQPVCSSNSMKGNTVNTRLGAPRVFLKYFGA